MSRYDQSAWNAILMTKREMKRILQTQVCDCISTETKRETSDA